MAEHAHYYVPAQSRWPFLGAIGLGSLMVGAANLLHHHPAGYFFFIVGALIVSYILFQWWADVIKESMSGLYSAQMDSSFRWGMGWFIFSEVMFFAAFFGVLFFVHEFSLPWLEEAKILWPNFKAEWPLLHNPDPTKFPNPRAAMHAWGLPALNTCILLTSGVTITIAHWALRLKKQKTLLIFQMATVLLGLSFIAFQAEEYIYAYTELGLRLDSGIYGSTFFMLTGFHGAHVTIGTLMLLIIWFRCLKGHFTPEHHFAFEAVAWYWHFVDVVWLLLFVLVYWL
ncbi:MAG: cytochrome c oxidase subunit 3 [Pseudomonadota bacterium]